MDDVGTQPRKSAERCKASCRIGNFLTNDHQLPWIVGGPAVTAPPYLPNVRKQLVKSPKTYVRDSGLLHALLGIHSVDELLGHPVAGMSWEGFVLENLLAAAPDMSGLRFIEQRRVRRLTWCWNLADAPESGRSRLRRTRRPS